jgi:hypothetical protein
MYRSSGKGVIEGRGQRAEGRRNPAAFGYLVKEYLQYVRFRSRSRRPVISEISISIAQHLDAASMEISFASGR